MPIDKQLLTFVDKTKIEIRKTTANFKTAEW